MGKAAVKIDQGIAKAEVQEDATTDQPERTMTPPRPENAGAEPVEKKRPTHQGMLSLVGRFSLSVGKHMVKGGSLQFKLTVTMQVYCILWMYVLWYA